MNTTDPRAPFVVQVFTRGGWTTDTTSKRRRTVRDRLLWLTRSPRNPAPARAVDRDGRVFTP